MRVSLIFFSHHKLPSTTWHRKKSRIWAKWKEHIRSPEITSLESKIVFWLSDLWNKKRVSLTSHQINWQFLRIPVSFFFFFARLKSSLWNQTGLSWKYISIKKGLSSSYRKQFRTSRDNFRLSCWRKGEWDEFSSSNLHECFKNWPRPYLEWVKACESK